MRLNNARIYRTFHSLRTIETARTQGGREKEIYSFNNLGFLLNEAWRSMWKTDSYEESRVSRLFVARTPIRLI